MSQTIDERQKTWELLKAISNASTELDAADKANYNNDLAEFNNYIIKNQYARLITDFYKDGYRHKYRHVVKFIYECENADMVQSGCQKIVELFSEEGSPELTEPLKCLRKLEDHISLEIYRKYYFDSSYIHNIREAERQTSNSLRLMKGIETRLEQAEENLSGVDERFLSVQEGSAKTEAKLIEAKTKLEEAVVKLDGQEKISMTVMGMFTGIIMTFSGGLTVLGTAFSEINKAPFYKLAFLTAIVGAALFNAIFGIFYFTGKLSSKPIHSHCQLKKKATCSECDNEEQCGLWKKAKRKYPYLLVINTIFLILIIVSVISSQFVKDTPETKPAEEPSRVEISLSVIE